MKSQSERTQLFLELEKWSQQTGSYSMHDFLKEKELSLNKFEQIANTSKRFMKIWEKAESQAWENLKNALFTKRLPRRRIAEYLSKCDTFQNENPELVMKNLESSQATFELHLIATGDIDSLKKYGRIYKNNSKLDDAALLKCCLERGMMTQNDFDELVAIGANEDCD